MQSQSFKIFVVFFLAFLTGASFVVYPALGTAFTSSEGFGLSQSQFGRIFVPQVVCIIISCLVAPFLVNKFGPKKILSAGILLMILSVGAVWILQFFIQDKAFAFRTLLIFVSFMGLGFGLSITTLNPLVASFFEEQKSSAIQILQFTVGLGTMASPLIMSCIGDVKKWMLLPGFIFVSIGLVFIFFLNLKLKKEPFFELPKKIEIPSRLWIFFIAILLYGCIEGTFGSFGAIILKNQGLDDSKANLGLSLFWSGIAVNRLMFGILSPKFDLSKIFLFSPILVGILLFFIPDITSGYLLIVIAFCTGFFMGCIFPGSIGWGTIEFPAYSVLVSGFLMAANQIGTGLATNILGNFSSEIPIIVRALSFLTLLIFIVLIVLSKNSKIKEAF